MLPLVSVARAFPCTGSQNRGGGQGSRMFHGRRHQRSVRDSEVPNRPSGRLASSFPAADCHRRKCARTGQIRQVSWKIESTGRSKARKKGPSSSGSIEIGAKNGTTILKLFRIVLFQDAKSVVSPKSAITCVSQEPGFRGGVAPRCRWRTRNCSTQKAQRRADPPACLAGITPRWLFVAQRFCPFHG
jgi:hypothetical protein